ncbi:MAG: alpha-galactosidase [Spirochaetes bacterium]|nr:alpha-galactosidase [Spirochaetota bacterium]
MPLDLDPDIRRIELLPGERWWGGAIRDGIHAPFGKTSYECDLHEHTGNQSAPLLLSSKGRVIWGEHPFHFRFEPGAVEIIHTGHKIRLNQPARNLAGAYRAACAKWFPFSGQIPQALAFTAPQYNTWIEMKYEPTQEKVLDYAKRILAEGFPPGILMIDDNWMNDYGDWTFHRERFPDPKSMVAALHKMGFKLMLWVCPYVSPDSALGRGLLARKFVLKWKNGEPLLKKWWNGYSMLLDFTHPEALSWFKERLDVLVHQFKIDGFKFDAGDPLASELDLAWHKRPAPSEDCEKYAQFGLHWHLSEFRECWKCGGEALIQRQRDKHHSWKRDGGLQSLIPNGSAQSLVGHAFHCPDMIGGGLDGDFNAPDFKLDAELFVRYAQCAALFPMMQFSLAPWKAVSGKAMEAVKQAVKLRMEFGPRILQLAQNASETGEPILRPMEYAFPGQGLEEVDQQFMLGEEILVAPVVEKGATERKIVFPEGEWKNAQGSTFTGPATQSVEAPLGVLPWFQRVSRGG